MDFFTDPVLRGPTLGTMLMCLSASLVGVLVFVKRRSLLGEALSHATYPGVTLAALIVALFKWQSYFPLMVLVGAFAFASIGNFLLQVLQRKIKMHADAALCFVLASFFGLGTVVASYLQTIHPQEFRQIQSYLYGQSATLVDFHIWLYAFFSLGIIILLSLFYRQLQVAAFDPQFGRSLGLKANRLELLEGLLLTLAIVIGIRCVGVILMSAMLIAPAVSARQFTNKLSLMFVLAGIFGLISGFFGNYVSLKLSYKFSSSFPTGPMIVLVASVISLFSLLLAPQKGLIMRFIRSLSFRFKRLQENALKALWRFESKGEKGFVLSRCAHSKSLSRLVISALKWKGLIKKIPSGYCLTDKGLEKGKKIVRLHRLWEVYLFDYLGVDAEKVHKSAEEIEHILTEDLEKELILLLKDPQSDPHHQPIPSIEGVTAHG